MTTHGLTKHPIYNVWQVMIQRCTNPNASAYRYYGARGIAVCDEWQDSSTFFKWAFANGYKKGLTIDRRNNDGNYEPGNCRWTTRSAQQRNSRRLRKNNSSGYRGVTRDGKKWKAQITVDSTHYYLGMFDTALEAAHVRDDYVTAHHLEHTLNVST